MANHLANRESHIGKGLVNRPIDLKWVLYEVRSNLPNGTIARVLFCIYQENILLLHGFIKKTQKTPKQDLDLALKRKKKLEAGK